VTSPEAVAAPATTLIPAPESDSLSLSPAPETSPLVSSSGHAEPGRVIPAPVLPPLTDAQPTDPQTDTESIDLASSPANTLGLNDNLLLAGLVAVFALAVIGLVTAGGHRGSWRRH
jgi:hypothetical protein